MKSSRLLVACVLASVLALAKSAVAADDKVVDVDNSIIYFEKLRHNKVPVEMHIYQKGNHGFVFRHPGSTIRLVLVQARYCQARCAGQISYHDYVERANYEILLVGAKSAEKLVILGRSAGTSKPSDNNAQQIYFVIMSSCQTREDLECLWNHWFQLNG